MYRRLLVFLRPHAWRMGATIGSSLMAAALDVLAFTLLIPFLNALFGVPALIPQGTGWITAVQEHTIGWMLRGRERMDALLMVIVAITVLVLIKNVFVWLQGQLGATLQEFVTRDLRDVVWRHLNRLPLRWFGRTKTGQIISRVLADTEQTKTLITQLVTQSIQNSAQILLTVIALVNLSWQLTLISLVIAPLLTLALQPILRKLRKGHRTLRNEYGEMTSVLQEVVSGVRLVKSFGGEAYEERRFLDASGRYTRGMTRITRISFLSGPLTEVIGTSIAVLILWVGARQVLVTGTLSGSTLITFMILVMRLLPPLKSLSQTPTTAQQSLASAERIFEVLDQPTEQQLDRGTREVTGFHDSVRFEQVSFAYDDDPVLRDVSFTARKGEVVALVGASGAGKSTLVDLIPRFHEPTAGRILLDGTDVREIRLDSLRRLIGIVSQDTVLFNDTVRHNIAYGSADRFSPAQVEAAARAANAHGFITELPEGYDTVLGERGTRLSGGQRQRLAIARALLVDRPILILDEATSALDTESERLVQEAIERLLAGRTVFVIAHRLSTVRHADCILVLERGAVVERGTHQALLARRGAYHRLHSLQFQSDASRPVAAAATATTEE
ncbi:MAG: ABC transporter ATP-binding protein [Gemmatimonadaceae bacterium]